MAKKVIKKTDFSKVAARVIKTPVEKFVEDSYLPYAHYVIMSRALISDDGLKPVQRRILFAMYSLGLTHEKDYMKAAQIVGEVMGKYHPHGDSSIGEAISRMGQDFSMRVPLIDVHGSVGFTTGDAPSAVRYWEGRPTAAAMELTNDLKEGAIEMGLNYDGKFAEPAMLPVKWPNGLINGSQGIAVGYSSNVISHNPTEVMDCLIALVKNPKLTIDEIMDIMPGPDMATGGTLLRTEGVRDYYETGKGSFSIRGTYVIEPGARGTHVAVFNEAPYQTSAEQVVKAVDKNKKKDRFKEVSYVKDLSDKNNGFMLSIGIKAGANPEVVMKEIFRWTPLEQSYSANMNILRDGVPRVSTILQILQDFIEFRTTCIITKTESELSKLQKEMDRLKGLILIDIDKTIDIIRKSKNDKVAAEEIMEEFNINEEQTQYILAMRLRRLTKADSESLKADLARLVKEVAYLNTLLNDDKAFNKYLTNDLEATKKVIADPRRTRMSLKTDKQLEKEAEAIQKAAEMDAKNSVCYVTLFANDTITRTAEPYNQAKSATPIITQVKTKTKENLIFVAKDGSALKLPASYVPQDTIIDVDITTGLMPDTIVGIGKEKFDKNSYGILITTTNGEVNIVNGGFPTSMSFSMVNLDEDELVLSAFWLEKDDEKNNSIVMISSDAYVLTFPIKDIRTSNSGAGTVLGMNLNEGEQLVGASVANPKTAEIASCSHKTIKVTKLKNIPERNRNTKGTVLHSLAKEDEILTAFAGNKVIANKNDRKVSLPKASKRASKGDKRTGEDIILGCEKPN